MTFTSRLPTPLTANHEGRFATEPFFDKHSPILWSVVTLKFHRSNTGIQLLSILLGVHYHQGLVGTERSTVKPCTSLLQTVSFVPGERKPVHFLQIQPA